jgi:SAM-dependent methyltransferase
MRARSSGTPPERVVGGVHGDVGGAEPAFEERWRRRFEQFAVERDDDAGIAGWSRTGLDARMRRFRAVWQPSSRGGRWLDAGCGAGSYARFLQASGKRVVAVDYSLPTLAKARVRCDDSIVFAACDVRRLPFGAAVFDGALCLGVMQALGDSEAALAELSAVVVPGGELWVDALNRGFPVNALRIAWRRLRGRRAHLRYERPSAIVGVLRAHGFSDVTVYWMPIAPARSPRLQRLLERPSMQRLLQRVPGLGRIASHAFLVHGRKAGIARKTD